jgi:hypothetical protein
MNPKVAELLDLVDALCEGSPGPHYDRIEVVAGDTKIVRRCSREAVSYDAYYYTFNVFYGTRDFVRFSDDFEEFITAMISDLCQTYPLELLAEIE